MQRSRMLVMGVLASLSGCTKQLDVQSTWAAHPIAVDGRGDDWADLQVQQATNEKISFGVANDATHLYLMLATERRPVVRGIQSWGVTLWLDPSAERTKRLGLRIRGGPGPDDDERVRAPRRDRAAAAAPEGEEPPRPAGGPLPLELEIVEANGATRPLPQGAAAPVVAVGRDGFLWTYEVALPLRGDGGQVLALKAQPGSTADVGVELIIPTRAPVGGAGGGYLPVWGGGGVWSGSPRRPSEKAPDPTDIWLRVKLARPPA